MPKIWGQIGIAFSHTGIEEGPLPTPHRVPHMCLYLTACMAFDPLDVFEQFEH